MKANTEINAERREQEQHKGRKRSRTPRSAARLSAARLSAGPVARKPWPDKRDDKEPKRDDVKGTIPASKISSPPESPFFYENVGTFRKHILLFFFVCKLRACNVSEAASSVTFGVGK